MTRGWWLLALVAACGNGGGAPGPEGEVCGSDGDCDGLLCVAASGDPPTDLDPLELACGALEDDAGDEGDACQDARECARGICLLAGACAAPCTSAADCGDDQRCAPVFARTSEDSLAALSACVAICDLGRGAEITSAIEREAILAGDAELELTAFDGDRPTFAVLEHLDPDWPGAQCRPPLCLERLTTRAGSPLTLFDAAEDYATAEPPLVPVASGNHTSPLVLQLPVTDAPGFSPDGYLAQLRSEQPGDLRVTRISGDGGRQLDLNVFYVGALDLQPEGERGPELLAQALDRVDEVLGQADIAIGEVRQIAVRGALPMRGTYFEDGDSAQGFTMLQVRFGSYVELPGLFQLSAGAGNRAINLFLLSDIEPLMSGREPEAEAGGIPGPPAMHGTAGSGIAVAVDMMMGNPGAFGRTLAHELAHYLGLFHVSEADGSVLDNLADTPECRAARDLAGNGLDREDCAEHGADNLMFWAKAPGIVLTEQQRAVLRANPILR
jgi:hypothetical protein